MGDHRLPDHAQPVELLDVYLGGDLQPPPGDCPLGPPKPPEDQTWAVDPAGATRQDAPPWSSDVEPSHLGSCSSQGEPRQSAAASPGPPGDSRGLGSPQQNRSSSTQVVFWAGILQAQMCVLDLEEELEKTEGLRAGLKCCLPPAPAELPGHMDLHPSPPGGEDSGEDSSGPEEEKQAWPREGTPGLSPEWGAEEESVFFDNPLFLESPGSEASASGERFSWGFPDPTADVNLGPDGPQALEPPLLGGTVAWELGSEPEWGDHGAERGGRNTPPSPVPTYKLHPCCTFEATTEGAVAAPSGQEESQVSAVVLGTSPGLHGDEEGTWPSSGVPRPQPCSSVDRAFWSGGVGGDGGEDQDQGRLQDDQTSSAGGGVSQTFWQLGPEIPLLPGAERLRLHVSGEQAALPTTGHSGRPLAILPPPRPCSGRGQGQCAGVTSGPHAGRAVRECRPVLSLSQEM